MTGSSGRVFPEPGASSSADYAHAKSAVRFHCRRIRLFCSMAIVPENTKVNGLVLEPGGMIARHSGMLAAWTHEHRKRPRLGDFGRNPIATAMFALILHPTSGASCINPHHRGLDSRLG
jgi:hypothetical protein